MGSVIAVSNIETPLGSMAAAAADAGICLLGFRDRPGQEEELARLERDLGAEARPAASPWLDQLETQLGEYFSLSRRAFGIPLLYIGTDFQKAVWRGLEAIPYGTTLSYGEEARALGKPGSARAVALANARNRIAILIPCHRAIGADGSISGYAWGQERKKRLLELESIGLTSGPRPL